MDDKNGKEVRDDFVRCGRGWSKGRWSKEKCKLEKYDWSQGIKRKKSIRMRWAGRDSKRKYKGREKKELASKEIEGGPGLIPSKDRQTPLPVAVTLFT